MGSSPLVSTISEKACNRCGCRLFLYFQGFADILPGKAALHPIDHTNGIQNNILIIRMISGAQPIPMVQWGHNRQGGIPMEIRVGERIRDLRKKAGLTQEQLAETLGVTAGAVYKWESGVSQT